MDEALVARKQAVEEMWSAEDAVDLGRTVVVKKIRMELEKLHSASPLVATVWLGCAQSAQLLPQGIRSWVAPSSHAVVASDRWSPRSAGPWRSAEKYS